MNQVSKMSEGNFDELSLRIESGGNGRGIVACDTRTAAYVSEDGQVYEDQDWRVKIYNQRLFACDNRNMIAITYKGKHAIPENSSLVRKNRQFNTGKICVSLQNSSQEDGTLKSEISMDSREYSSVLNDEYGIYDGYVFDSPNRAFHVGRFSNYCSLVVSDGEVSCEYNGAELENPTVDDLLEMCQGDRLYYEVQGATWAVELRWYYDAENGVPEIGLYTQINDFQIVLSKLEQYLQEQDLARFDDLLPC